MTDEKLIEAVRRHEELYNVKHPSYMKQQFKNRIWGIIANELNMKDGRYFKILFCTFFNILYFVTIWELDKNIFVLIIT